MVGKRHAYFLFYTMTCVFAFINFFYWRNFIYEIQQENVFTD